MGLKNALFGRDMAFCPTGLLTNLFKSFSLLNKLSQISYPSYNFNFCPILAVMAFPSLAQFFLQIAHSSPAAHHSSTGAIAGGVVGGLILLAFLAGAAFWFRKRRRRAVDQEAATNPYPMVMANGARAM